MPAIVEVAVVEAKTTPSGPLKVDVAVEVAMNLSAARLFVPVAASIEPFHVTTAFVESPVVSKPIVPLFVIVPPVRPLLVATEVTVPGFERRQLPLIEKQPFEDRRLIPP